MLLLVQEALLTRPTTSGPPPILRLVGHPVRWRLLQELARSDRGVAELTRLIEAPQPLVSYHLRELRTGELVSMRRSSADRRDSYYRIELDRCRTQLEAAGGALHPGLQPLPAPTGPHRSGGRRPRRRRILFLCTGNSARSQIAEALLQQQSDGTIEAASAGSNPKPLHPNAVRVMKRRGVDISANRTKHLDEFAAQHFDVVITLCDRVREVCPEFPGQPALAHWSIPDPALEGPNAHDSYPAFERTASDLESRIHYLRSAIGDRR
jgi:protein-tyrosine-phosphatase/DNA-binding transcriptional ArsR family regulator